MANVDRIYTRLRQLATDFEFMPDARINESALSVELGASRTPLREALNRLVAEGFLTYKTNRGFFCRSLSPALVLDLYEARVAVETETVKLACKRASDTDLQALKARLDGEEPTSDPDILLEHDEGFHLAIASLSQNHELRRILQNLNDRVRYIRLIYLKSKASEGTVKSSAHRLILNAMLDRDAQTAAAAMRQHIERRREDAVAAVRTAYSQLYVPDDREKAAR